MDLENVKTHEQIRVMLNRHFDALSRSNPLFAATRKIFIPENNLAHEASHMQRMLSERADYDPNIRTFYQKPDRPGVHKGADTADYYVAATTEALRLGALHFSHDFFTTTRNYTNDSMKATLQEEMQRFHVELKRAKTNFERTRRVVTGKSGSAQDDLFIAFAQGLYWGSKAEHAAEHCFV